jgi:hypothetical protein
VVPNSIIAAAQVLSRSSVSTGSPLLVTSFCSSGRIFGSIRSASGGVPGAAMPTLSSASAVLFAFWSITASSTSRSAPPITVRMSPVIHSKWGGSAWIVPSR